MNLLEQAIRDNNSTQLRLLLDMGHDVNQQTENGVSLLRFVIQEIFDLEIIKLMIVYGADVNDRSPSNKKSSIDNSLLLYAVTNKMLDLVMLLVSLGGDVNERTSDYQSHLHIRVKNENKEFVKR